MEFTNIVQIKTPISRIGLGTWAMGGSLWGGTDKQQSIATIHQALEKGVNFIDTAPGYGKGEAETLVGEAIKAYGKREEVIIATKVGLNQESPDKVFRDLRRNSILKELQDSLNRLQVDYIDLYQAHWPDPKTPISETAETFKEILNQGKIKAIGLCNFSVEQVEEFRKTVDVHAEQFPFNIFEREAEKTVLSYCLRSGVSTIGYSGLTRGLLSGKMSKEREFKGDDLRKGMDPKFKDPQFSQYLAAAEALKKWVEEKYERPLIALAIRWNMDKGVNIPLWGARTPDQLKDIPTVFDWKLTEEDFEQIDKIIAEHVKDPVGVEFMEPPVRE